MRPILTRLARPKTVEAHRAWSLGEVVNGDWRYDYGVKNFYVRACLTNAANEAHHCGSKA